MRNCKQRVASDFRMQASEHRSDNFDLLLQRKPVDSSRRAEPCQTSFDSQVVEATFSDSLGCCVGGGLV
jgi:hypothetical protein